MNTIKTLKSYALYTLLAVCGFAVWYLGTAFVLLLKYAFADKSVVGGSSELVSSLEQCCKRFEVAFQLGVKQNWMAKKKATMVLNKN